MTDIFQPAYEEWTEVLRQSLATHTQRASKLGAQRIRAARIETVKVAIDYTRQVVDTARSLGIELVAPTQPELDALGTIIMAGHQPVIYHPGLLAKTSALSRFAAESSSVGINIVIDTDQGDGGAISWPRINGSSLEIKSASLLGSISDEGALYATQRLGEREKTERIFAGIVSDLEFSGLSSAARSAARAGQLYAILAGQPVALAHTVVRWALNSARHLEAPLSQVLAAPTLSAVLSELVSDRDRLAVTYNETLDAYRTEHRIANPANPFPNMKVTPDSVELPLWIVKGATRRPFISEGSSLELALDERLVTRGSLTTLILRGYCSDLFIHGTGGARYDLFVERLAQRYLGFELPRYVVASATRHIVPGRVVELEQAIKLASAVKEMISKTESYLGQGIFRQEEESALSSICISRAKLRQEMSLAQDPATKSRVARELNDANRRAREVIEHGSLRQTIAAAAANQAALARWSYREFPFMFWEDG